jgi:hypothetical protein
MKRWLFFNYGVFCHLLFRVTSAYLAGFVGNLVVAKSIDTPSAAPLGVALAPPPTPHLSNQVLQVASVQESSQRRMVDSRS